ncbi:MAG: hypothetical protein AAF433_21130 [Bacteroidota bacterium]
MRQTYFKLDAFAYDSMLQRLNGLHFAERAGGLVDISFLVKDNWLVDAAVSERLIERNGHFEIHLLFAYYQYPLTFISRYITSANGRKKAEVMANIMRRQAAKDQRGTIKIDPNFWRLPPN